MELHTELFPPEDMLQFSQHREEAFSAFCLSLEIVTDCGLTLDGYLLEQDFPGMRIGPEPTTDSFIAVMYGENEGSTPGNALVVDPKKPFRKLSRFGNAFLNRTSWCNSRGTIHMDCGMNDVLDAVHWLCQGLPRPPSPAGAVCENGTLWGAELSFRGFLMLLLQIKESTQGTWQWDEQKCAGDVNGVPRKFHDIIDGDRNTVQSGGILQWSIWERLWGGTCRRTRVCSQEAVAPTEEETAKGTQSIGSSETSGYLDQFKKCQALGSDIALATWRKCGVEGASLESSVAPISSLTSEDNIYQVILRWGPLTKAM
ncbi:hypothetical protein P7K49_017602 [Saguinus oedipus]|uniref:Uncharacterized protein n=1 Tax=Saguinus oedipus TaxID=9490 RepID=A0ABQ9V3P4_SAGOE|nr:hypothetical protein P7K49_017602 [Saguinus oedipus]